MVLQSLANVATVIFMQTITITQAKRQLGAYLKRAASGEEIGIVSGADIIALRKVQVTPADERVASSLREDGRGYQNQCVNPYEIETFKGGPIDGAINHDRYIYQRKGGQ